MRRTSATGLYLGFGLLPFWSSILYVYLGSEGLGRPEEYWVVAPWVIIMAAPFSAITLAMAGIITLVDKDFGGGPTPRSRYAIACFVFFLAIVLVAMEDVWSSNPPKVMTEDQATRAAEWFVEKNSEIARLATGPVRAYSRGNEHIERGYRFVIDVGPAAGGETKFRAIVETSRFFGQERLRLRCLIPAREYAEPNTSDDPCHGGKAP
jgi:hypothetical protein